MKVTYALRRRPYREPVTALLLPGSDAGGLFAVCEELCLKSFPAVFATADGFLVKLPAPHDIRIAGAVHLRGLSESLLLPVDAELVPLLLPDEARALVSKRGLIFLPGPRYLEFHPDRPLALDRLLKLPVSDVAGWQALPLSPGLAEGLVEVGLSEPPPTADDVLAPGGEGIGTELPEPGPASSPASRAMAGVLYGIGKSFAWTGTKLGLGALAGAGAALINQALALAPRLSEKLMGKQEAMLRELLRDFREGKIERALRRALPMGGDVSRGSAPASDAIWPRHRLFYSLKNLLANRGKAASVWFTPDNLYFALTAEYRKQADLAARQGDYRRAAFIYARLLHDFAAAARILSQGGLHRDAAVIYMDVLDDLRAAAREWEATGEVDRAVGILVNLGDHLEAAELLRRVGDQDRALKHYQLAAGQHLAVGRYFQAGELLRGRAERFDLALVCYEQGWAARPGAGALPCGLYLARHFTEQADIVALNRMLTEAETILETWDAEAASRFFHEIVRLSHAKQVSRVADDLRDRCLLGLARKMQEHASSQRQRDRFVSTFFPADSPWPAPLVRDAQFAFREDHFPRLHSRELRSLVRLGNSTVRAVCYMPSAGDVFVGLENGEILGYNLISGKPMTVVKEDGPILGLLADPTEEYLIGLVDQSTLIIARRSAQFRGPWTRQLLSLPYYALAVGVANRPMPFLGVLGFPDIRFFRTDNPSWAYAHVLSSTPAPQAALLGPVPGSESRFWGLLFFEKSAMIFPDMLEPKTFSGFEVDACPQVPTGSSLYQAPLQGWMFDDRTVRAQWTDKEGLGHRLDCAVDGHETPVVQGAAPLGLAPGAQLLDLGIFAPNPEREKRWDATWSLCNPVAAFPISSSDEYLIVDSDGTLARVHCDWSQSRN